MLEPFGQLRPYLPEQFCQVTIYFSELFGQMQIYFPESVSTNKNLFAWTVPANFPKPLQAGSVYILIPEKDSLAKKDAHLQWLSLRFVSFRFLRGLPRYISHIVLVWPVCVTNFSASDRST